MKPDMSKMPCEIYSTYLRFFFYCVVLFLDSHQNCQIQKRRNKILSFFSFIKATFLSYTLGTRKITNLINCSKIPRGSISLCYSYLHIPVPINSPRKEFPPLGSSSFRYFFRKFLILIQYHNTGENFSFNNRLALRFQ